MMHHHHVLTQSAHVQWMSSKLCQHLVMKACDAVGCHCYESFLQKGETETLTSARRGVNPLIAGQLKPCSLGLHQHSESEGLKA